MLALALLAAPPAYAGDAPPPEPITINWDRVGAASVGFVGGLVGLLLGGAVGSNLGCALEQAATGDACGDARAVPAILLGLGVGALFGYMAVEAWWGELDEVLPASGPNVSGLAPSAQGLNLRFSF
ncbi:MAG: hypothetical protein R3F60_25235 [bacterium]